MHGVQGCFGRSFSPGTGRFPRSLPPRAPLTPCFPAARQRKKSRHQKKATKKNGGHGGGGPRAGAGAAGADAGVSGMEGQEGAAKAAAGESRERREVHERREALVAPHVESFDWLLAQGLALVVDGLDQVEVRASPRSAPALRCRRRFPQRCPAGRCLDPRELPRSGV